MAGGKPSGSDQAHFMEPVPSRQPSPQREREWTEFVYRLVVHTTQAIRTKNQALVLEH